MNNDKKLNSIGQQLCAQLAAINAEKSVKKSSSQLINVAGVGHMFSAAYEQLRNAAEYAQEHLLLQNAIRRFFVRNLFLQTSTLVDKTIAEELIIELTQAGYLKNNTQPVEIIDELYAIIEKQYANYRRLKIAGINEKKARSWTLDMLSIASDVILVPDEIQPAFRQFAYQHYQSILQKKSFASGAADEANFEASLYVAVHRSLFMSDLAVVRYDMCTLYAVSDHDINNYVQFNENIDQIFASEMTHKLMRYINRYGAPLRIMLSLVQTNDNVSELLPDATRFESAYSRQIKKEYKSATRKLNKGLLRSIAFLLITKGLIGVAIEVPFDIALTGTVLMIPLLINLFAPVVYLAVLRIGFRLPGEENTRAIKLYADNMLYNETPSLHLYPAVKDKKYPFSFSVIYGLMFVVIFGLVFNLLLDLGFNIVQGGIFFIFLAFASFLGFRLSHIVKEMELVVTRPGMLTTLREFLFTPFTLTGKWLSEKYQKTNIVALVLDTLIEMPLKTVLRLIRQLNSFIDEKKEDL